MQSAIVHLQAILDEWSERGLLRSLRDTNELVDFCSNDYLGFARSPELKATIQIANHQYPHAFTGATGSRLLAGNTRLMEEVEAEVARYHQAESALIFNSGYDANSGLLASIARRGDTLITDELIHASMIDGARLSYATRLRFRHNDLDDLEEKLRQAQGQTYVAVESLYSMDGDFAPLQELAELCDQYGAALLVDEAHATGIYGPDGEGLVAASGLAHRVFARIHTFGKAMGVHGAAVIGPAVLRDYLINFARSFIYTTALPPHSYLAIRTAYQYLRKQEETRRQLHEQLACFRQQVALHLPGMSWTKSGSPIQCLIVPGNENARRVAAAAQTAGFDVRAILSPTVPVGQERLRICVHAFNTHDQINKLTEVLQKAVLDVSTV